VVKVPISGGAPTTLASMLDVAAFTALDGTSFYWTDSLGGTVMKIALSGGTPTTLASGQSPIGIAVDSASVYWANGSGTVMKVPLGGGTPTTLARGQDWPECVIVDSTYVYWTDANSGTVMKAAK
jgi:sugar lactone lactonase YvrE